MFAPTVAVLVIDGDQLPDMIVLPFIKLAGKLGGVVPCQAEIGVNVGLMLGGVTLTIKNPLSAHCPAFGVKM